MRYYLDGARGSRSNNWQEKRVRESPVEEKIERKNNLSENIQT